MNWDLVADIGGTNMRVAQVLDGRIAQRQDYKMEAGLDISEVLRTFAQKFDQAPTRIVCAGAGPVNAGSLTLTNGGWSLSEPALKAKTNVQSVRIINDFEAAAWSLSDLGPEDVQPIGSSPPLSRGNRVAVGPGTGLGVGALFAIGAQYTVVAGEGGHVAIGPRNPWEVPIFERFIQLWPETRIGHSLCVEAEAMLSGTGLPILYTACGGATGTSGADIFERACLDDPAAQTCITLFKTHLAALCGDLAVTQMAKGGVFLLGGVAQSNPQIFDHEFWNAFADGGRFSKLRASCGVYLVTLPGFGLRGCVNYLKQSG